MQIYRHIIVNIIMDLNIYHETVVKHLDIISIYYKEININLKIHHHSGTLKIYQLRNPSTLSSLSKILEIKKKSIIYHTIDTFLPTIFHSVI